MVIKCQVCGTRNRVDEARARSKRPTCGRCGAHLPYEPSGPRNTPIVASDATWKDLLKEAGDRPLLVDCWAEWCGPCKQLAPTIQALAADADERYLVAKLNTDENPGITGEFEIDNIPTLLVIQNGRVVERAVGVRPRDAIEQLMEPYM